MAQHRTAGFTLIELLVVVAVIGLLAGMLLGGVKVVTESAKSSKCTSNLRQVGMAVQVYAHTSEGFMPPAYVRASADIAVYQAKTLAGFLAVNNTIDLNFVPTTATPTSALKSVFDCPSGANVPIDTTLSMNFNAALANQDFCNGFYVDSYGSTGLKITTSYTANMGCLNYFPDLPFQEVNSTGQFAAAPYNRTRPLASLPRPSSLALLWDGAGPFLNFAPARISARHANRTRTNVLFADGRAASYATFEYLHKVYQSSSLTGEVTFYTE